MENPQLDLKTFKGSRLQIRFDSIEACRKTYLGIINEKYGDDFADVANLELLDEIIKIVPDDNQSLSFSWELWKYVNKSRLRYHYTNNLSSIQKVSEVLDDRTIIDLPIVTNMCAEEIQNMLGSFSRSLLYLNVRNNIKEHIYVNYEYLEGFKSFKRIFSTYKKEFDYVSNSNAEYINISELLVDVTKYKSVALSICVNFRNRFPKQFNKLMYKLKSDDAEVMWRFSLGDQEYLEEISSKHFGDKKY